MNPPTEPQILILDQRLDSAELSRLVDAFFGNMVKYVVDIDQGRLAIGGELHSDAEALLLETGSQQESLWGANYYPGEGRDSCIEFTSLINIRPTQGNPGMEVQDPAIQQRIRDLTFALIGEGELLP